MTLSTATRTSVSRPPTDVYLELVRYWMATVHVDASRILETAGQAAPNWYRLSTPGSVPAEAVTTGGGSTVGLPTFGPLARDDWQDVVRLMQDGSFDFLRDEPDLYGDGDYEPV